MAKKSKRNFFVTLIIVAILGYSTLNWVLPSFISGLGAVKNVVKPSQKQETPKSQTAAFAPPVLSVPYEATSSAQIDIKGYGTPGSKIILYIDDIDTQTVEVEENGSFTFKDVSLSLGTNNIYGKSIDDKKQESLPSKTIKLFYDNENPSLTITEPEDNKTIEGGDEQSSSSNRKVKISGNTEVGAKVYINGSQVIVSSEGNFTSEQPLNDGDNVFDIKSVDSSSNFTEVQRRVVFKPQETQ